MRYILLSICLLACGVNADVPAWEQQIPAEVNRQFLHHGAIGMETPCAYREQLRKLFLPLVRECKTAREAVLKVASNMTKTTGVYYSTNRRHAIMNTQEALAEKMVSCTGQSILLAGALRSLGIPARLVVVSTWNHVSGNHTWCEAWFDGGWHMIEFNERDFNTPWVMESVAMLDPKHPFQRIYAIKGPGTKHIYPYTELSGMRLAVEDVTDRYMQLAQRHLGNPEMQRVMVDLHPRQDAPRHVEVLTMDGQVLERAALPTTRDDMRKFAVLNVPRKGKYMLKLPRERPAIMLHPTEPPAQVLRFSEKGKKLYLH